MLVLLRLLPALNFQTSFSGDRKFWMQAEHPVGKTQASSLGLKHLIVITGGFE
jgi:hypothetical protein